MNITRRRLEAALDTLGDLSGQDHELIDGQVRDDIGHLRYVIETILEERERR